MLYASLCSGLENGSFGSSACGWPLITSFLFWSYADKITNCLGSAGGKKEENPKTNVFFASLSLLIKLVY